MARHTRPNEKQAKLSLMLREGPVRVFFDPAKLDADLPEGFKLVAVEGFEMGVVEIGWRLGLPLELNDDGIKATLPVVPGNLPSTVEIPWRAVFRMGRS